MRLTWTIGPLLIAAAMAMTGCNNNRQDEVAVLTEENRALQQMLDDRNRALEASDAERRQQALRLADLQRQLEAQPTAAHGGFAGDPTGFEAITGVSAERGPGVVRVRVEGDVLFDSGRATLKDTARRTLNDVASVLNSRYAGKRISVEGHTDTDPIRRSGFKTNYHLGFERAFAVREHLISRGVAGDRLSLKSYGPNDPRATKAASRRVEVIVHTDS